MSDLTPLAHLFLASAAISLFIAVCGGKWHGGK